jgi:hypothetical protein
MKWASVFLLLAVTVATGCALGPTLDFNDNQTLARQLNSHFEKIQTDYFTALPSDASTAKQKRDELIHDALAHIDGAYGEFVTDLTAGRDKINFFADVVELGTSAAVGIASGERALQILGVALTGFRGTRRSADLNFYKDQSTPILINKMDDNRAKAHAAILARKKEGVDTYPIKEAITDIVAYYNAGTLVRAFTELQKDTAAQAKKSEDTLQVLKGVTITPEATVESRNLSVASHTILLNLLADLKDADAQKKTAATGKIQRIVAALEKDKDVMTALKAADASSKEPDGLKLRAALIKIRTSAADTNNNSLLNTINAAIIDNGR